MQSAGIPAPMRNTSGFLSENIFLSCKLLWTFSPRHQLFHRKHILRDCFIRQKPYFPLKKEKKKKKIFGQLYFWSYFWQSHETLEASIGHCVTRDQPRNSRLPANLVLLSLPQRGVGSLEFCIIKEHIKSYLQPICECWIYSIRISWLVSQWQFTPGQF